MAYRLAVSLPDAAVCAEQRLTLSDGKPINVKLPKGVEEGMQIRLSGKGQQGPGGAGAEGRGGGCGWGARHGWSGAGRGGTGGAGRAGAVPRGEGRAECKMERGRAAT